jgi:hypothetical protein
MTAGRVVSWSGENSPVNDRLSDKDFAKNF